MSEGKRSEKNICAAQRNFPTAKSYNVEPVYVAAYLFIGVYVETAGKSEFVRKLLGVYIWK